MCSIDGSLNADGIVYVRGRVVGAASDPAGLQLLQPEESEGGGQV